MFRQQVERCWKKPYGGIEAQKVEAVFTIKLKRDGTLETMPVPLPGGSSPVFPRLSGERAARDHRVPAV
jgi:colicin import membrane protein